MNAQNQGYQQQYQYQGQQNMNRQYQQPNTQNKTGQQQPTPSRNRKPIHTAFFSNIPYNYPEDKFQDFVKSFGEVSYMYSLIKKQGIAFVTYYDIRNAQKAVEKANETYLNSRQVKTNYANKSHFPHLDPKETCSTILVRSSVAPSKMTIHEVIQKMKDFGEIMTAFPVEGQPGTFVVKYYNILDARRAMEDPYPKIGSEPASLEFKLEDEDNPDIPTQPKQNNPYQMPQGMPMYNMQPNMGYPPQQPNMQMSPQYPRMPPQSQQPPPPQGQPPLQQQPPPSQYYGHQQPPPYYNQMPPQMPPPSYGVNQQQQGTAPPPSGSQPSQLSPNAFEKLKNLQMQMKKKGNI
ncbi:hypothetical protein M9Y10_017813 [Tritrichomonas musculus]|uniref:RRM domain-containing protein n=1 Tax=Tritrichomonas musculus TaxID=1915356 RepID=A0ABR2GN57_9EUKA